MSDHTFCRMLLKETMVEVRNKVGAKEISTAWAYKGTGYTEFQGPNKFYHHGDACCLYAAKADGWSAYLEKLEKTNKEEQMNEKQTTEKQMTPMTFVATTLQDIFANNEWQAQFTTFEELFSFARDLAVLQAEALKVPGKTLHRIKTVKIGNFKADAKRFEEELAQYTQTKDRYLTDLEKDVIRGFEEQDWMYSEHVLGYCELCTAQQFGGVVSSLVKKGLIEKRDNDGIAALELINDGPKLKVKLDAAAKKAEKEENDAKFEKLAKERQKKFLEAREEKTTNNTTEEQVKKAAKADKEHFENIDNILSEEKPKKAVKKDKAAKAPKKTAKTKEKKISKEEAEKIVAENEIVVNNTVESAKKNTAKKGKNKKKEGIPAAPPAKERKLSNEALMLKLVRAKTDEEEITKQFKARYNGKDKAFVEKRITIYKKIAEKAIAAMKKA